MSGKLKIVPKGGFRFCNGLSSHNTLYQILDHDLEAQLGKVKKMLVKGNFVQINVKSTDKTGPKYLELKQKVFDYFKEEEELLGKNNVKLQFN